MQRVEPQLDGDGLPIDDLEGLHRYDSGPAAAWRSQSLARAVSEHEFDVLDDHDNLVVHPGRQGPGGQCDLFAVQDADEIDRLGQVDRQTDQLAVEVSG